MTLLSVAINIFCSNILSAFSALSDSRFIRDSNSNSLVEALETSVLIFSNKEDSSDFALSDSFSKSLYVLDISNVFLFTLDNISDSADSALSFSSTILLLSVFSEDVALVTSSFNLVVKLEILEVF